MEEGRDKFEFFLGATSVSTCVNPDVELLAWWIHTQKKETNPGTACCHYFIEENS
jgi:hypothetical protein